MTTKYEKGIQIEGKTFWKSVSKQKTIRKCKKRFYLGYIAKVPRSPMPEVANVGSVIHDSFEDIYKNRIDERWYDMTPNELYNDFYKTHKKFCMAHEKFTAWGKLYENNVKNLSAFETQRFFKFLKEIPRELMNDYFCPVSAEIFMKNGNYLYNYIADAVFRIYKTGDPAKDTDLMMFDLKSGSAKPEKVRSDDKGQAVTYSILWNDVLDDPEATKKAVETHENLVEFSDDMFRDLVSARSPFIKDAEKELYNAKKTLETIIETNKVIKEIGGRVKVWAIFYAANGKFFRGDIDKRALTYAHKRNDKMVDMLVEQDWSGVWGSRECQFDYVDKVTGEFITVKCDYHQICFEEKNSDLYEGLDDL